MPYSNGLPFIGWTEFRPIRILLSKFYKTQGGAAHKIEATNPQWRSCETCSVEELCETLRREETYQATTAESESQDLLNSEAEAREMLNKDSISFSEVWDLVQRAGLKGQRSRRERLIEGTKDGDRVQIWLFGMYCHGGITGLTSLTRERPFLTRLLARLVRQELPGLSFTSISLAIDATLKPHRDLANAVDTRSDIMGISEFKGGRLWVEDPAGTVKRRVSTDQVRVGKLLGVCQQAQIFDPRQWHGADKHQGTRATVSAYTARQLHNLDGDLIEVLRNLGLPLPVSGCPTPMRSEASSSSIQQPTNIHRATTEQAPPLTLPPSSETQDDDEDEVLTGFAGFVGSGLSGRCVKCGVVLGEGLEVTPAEPWNAAHTVEASPSSFSEAALERATTLLRRKCSQGLYEKQCPSCAEAHGHKRKCRRLAPEDVGKGVLSMDFRASSRILFWTSVFLGCQLEYAGGR